MKTYNVLFTPTYLIIKAEENKNLYLLMRESKINISSDCGGKGICGKCKVKVEGETSTLTEIEKNFLTQKEIKDNFRLACQVIIRGDLRVEVKEKKEKLKNLEKLFKIKIKPAPEIKKKYLNVPTPSIFFQKPDWQRVKDSLKIATKPNITSLSSLPQILRESNHKITAVFTDKELISLEKGDTTKKIYGIGLDIGTTTVAGYLVDLKSGKNISVLSSLNPQIRYGEDVISRMNAVMEDKDSLYKMQYLIIEEINKIISFFKERNGINENHIYQLIAVGNPCMIHLLLGVNPINLSRSPYIPVISDSFEIKVKEIGIRINPEGKIKTLPAVSGFFGSDAIGMVLKERMHNSPLLCLGIDLGTNGEVVLGNRKKLLCTSCAAGPAFEGTKIYQGMIAQPGGISYVKISGDRVIFKTIDNATPCGICGSGVVDAVSEMLKLKIIDHTGRIKDREEYQKECKNSLYKRIKIFNNMNSFILANENETKEGVPIIITQKDVREVQLAKAAIYSAIKILCRKLKIKEEKISKIFLAGSFGNYLRVESAIRIGVLPENFKGKVKIIGNSAGEGAVRVLLSLKERKSFETISNKLKYIELSTEKNFQGEFAKSIYFEGGVKNE